MAVWRHGSNRVAHGRTRSGTKEMNGGSSASENARGGGFALENALREHRGDIAAMFQLANLNDAMGVFVDEKPTDFGGPAVVSVERHSTLSLFVPAAKNAVGRRRRELAAEYYVVLEPRIARDIPHAGTLAGSCVGNGDEQCLEEKVWQRAKDLEDAITGANVDRFKLLVMMLKATMDLTCALNMPGMDVPKRIWGQKLNDGVIGALGCVSAICSLYNVWPTRPQQSS